MTEQTPLEVVELEERLHDEVLCEMPDLIHGLGPCAIVAHHRLASKCPFSGAAPAICRVIVEEIKGWAATPCPSCGVPVGECWVVTAL